MAELGQPLAGLNSAAAGFNCPGRRVGSVELDGSDPHDAAIINVNE